MVDIEKNPYKADFPLLASRPDIAFLDSAATAQRPACVLDAERDFYTKMNANPLRGLYSLSVAATSEIGAVREQIARLIGAVDDAGKPLADDIVFTRNTSESLNLVAKSFAPTVLHAGDEVVITVMEHHSNLIPWQQACRAAGAKLAYLYPDEQGFISDEEIAAKIGPSTRIVAVGEVSNVMGVRNPVEKVAEAAHANGAYVVVDAAQSVPHMAVDVRALGADFLAFSGHKALGPMGIGVLWGKKKWLDAMPPFLFGGEMIQSVSREGAVYAEIPHKFEAGTVNAGGAVGLEAAIHYIEQIGFDRIQQREEYLSTLMLEGIKKIPHVHLLGADTPEQHHGIFSFTVDDVHPHDVSAILADAGIAVRAGHHCAQPLLQHLGVNATTRASLAFYNTEAEVEAFLKTLREVRSQMGYAE